MFVAGNFRCVVFAYKRVLLLRNTSYMHPLCTVVALGYQFIDWSGRGGGGGVIMEHEPCSMQIINSCVLHEIDFLRGYTEFVSVCGISFILICL